MSAIVKSLNASLATLLPPPCQMLGFGRTLTARGGGGTNGAGEDLPAVCPCYIDSDGNVMRAIMSLVDAGTAVNDVQTMSVVPAVGASNGILSGTYFIGYKGVYAGPFTIGTTVAADVQTALRALSTVGSGNVTVTGTFPAYVITGISGLAATPLQLFEVQSNIVTANGSPMIAQITHTTVGRATGDDTMQSPSKVKGWTTIPAKRGEPVTLYFGVEFSYSDFLLTPGMDLYLSSTVPGGLDTAPTITPGQLPIAFAVNSENIYTYDPMPAHLGAVIA